MTVEAVDKTGVLVVVAMQSRSSFVADSVLLLQSRAKTRADSVVRSA